MPLNAVVVRVNVEDNGFGSQVHLFEGAASNHSGQTTIYAPSNGRLDNAALSAKASVASFRGAAIEATRIRLVTLSEALQAAAPRGVRAPPRTCASLKWTRKATRSRCCRGSDDAAFARAPPVRPPGFLTHHLPTNIHAAHAHVHAHSCTCTCTSPTRYGWTRAR